MPKWHEPEYDQIDHIEHTYQKNSRIPHI